MIGAAVVEMWIGVKAEGQSLERHRRAAGVAGMSPCARQIDALSAHVKS